MSYDLKHYYEGIIRIPLELPTISNSNSDSDFSSDSDNESNNNGKTNNKSEKTKKHFNYYYTDSNKKVEDSKEISRIESIGIPPNWDNVWISRDPNTEIIAIGSDSKGKKQYIYSQEHNKRVQKEKYERMKEFVRKMPELDKHLSKIIKQETKKGNKTATRERIIALMLKLIQKYHFRVGKEEYARLNGSYGICSLRRKHFNIEKNNKTNENNEIKKENKEKITIEFLSKSKQVANFVIDDPFFVKELKLLLNLPFDSNENMFQCTEDEGSTYKKITYKDLNAFLQSIIGKQFTIKDFRTYGSNITFVTALLIATLKNPPTSNKKIEENIKEAFRLSAETLKHTKAISKKSYVMNDIVNLYRNNTQYFVSLAENPKMSSRESLLSILKIISKSKSSN